MDKLKLGISTCLLGFPVRYDGGHKLNHYLKDILGRYVEFVPVCPEVECGFGVPREPIRLVGEIKKPRLITVHSKKDLTDQMSLWAAKRVKELEAEGLCGFVFKSESPSSGMERVKVYNDKGVAEKKGVGMFARAFMTHFPNLPVEEEGRLNDAILRENFIERIFTYARWQELIQRENLKYSNLVAFHTHNKLLILAHSPQHYREMGRLVAAGKGMLIRDLVLQYESLLMEAMKMKATPKKNANVLMHMMGYFKKDLSSWEKGELLAVIDQYRQNLIPLIVPLTLLKHYVGKYDEPYLQEQTYLDPHPMELQLRNHV
ncbi:MAG: DUF523 and DUF1722 domain-containing protein [Syntrophaceae bacterium]|nr:DUF523 and DUF1722 domain-containing protein [Syntrophaceae bacterium]